MMEGWRSALLLPGGTCREACTVKKGGCALDPDWTGFTLECVPEDGGDFGDGGNCLRPCNCDGDCAIGSVCGQTVGTQRYCIGTGVGVLCR